MAYVIDTPSQRLESYIILTPADVGRRSARPVIRGA